MIVGARQSGLSISETPGEKTPPCSAKLPWHSESCNSKNCIIIIIIIYIIVIVVIIIIIIIIIL